MLFLSVQQGLAFKAEQPVDTRRCSWVAWSSTPWAKEEKQLDVASLSASRTSLTPHFSKSSRAHVRPGSLVWTDGHKSYNWLNACPEFKHQSVVHARGEFSKKDENGVVVSTNAVEGMLWP